MPADPPRDAFYYDLIQRSPCINEEGYCRKDSYGLSDSIDTS